MSNDAPFFDDLPSSSPGDSDQPYGWIDEWLCEYVDGTMDPAIEAVFTSYVEANPQLKEHIEELQQTRDLLKQCRHVPDDSPSADHACTNVCNQVESDLLCSKLSFREALDQRPQFTAGLFASVITALVIGVVVGATVIQPMPPSSASGSASSEGVTTEQHMAADRPALPATMPPAGAQAERSTRTTRRPVAAAANTASTWATTPTFQVDSLHVPPSMLGFMRTSR